MCLAAAVTAQGSTLALWVCICMLRLHTYGEFTDHQAWWVQTSSGMFCIRSYQLHCLLAAQEGAMHVEHDAPLSAVAAAKIFAFQRPPVQRSVWQAAQTAKQQHCSLKFAQMCDVLVMHVCMCAVCYVPTAHQPVLLVRLAAAGSCMPGIKSVIMIGSRTISAGPPPRWGRGARRSLFLQCFFQRRHMEQCKIQQL